MKIGNLEVYGIIYKIENLVNGKVYIGKTTLTFRRRYHSGGGKSNVERVYNFHKNCKENNKAYIISLLDDMERFKLNSFKVTEFLDFAFSKDELNIKEQIWISLYDCINNGYNTTFGGDGTSGWKPNEEWIDAHSGDKNYFYGKGYLKSGKNNPFYGIHKYGKDNPRSKKIICITSEKIFYSAIEGSKFYNCDNSNIKKSCDNQKYSCGKLEDGTRLRWKYIENLTLEEYIKYDIENKLKELSNEDSSFLI